MTPEEVENLKTILYNTCSAKHPITKGTRRLVFIFNYPNDRRTKMLKGKQFTFKPFVCFQKWQSVPKMAIYPKTEISK